MSFFKKRRPVTVAEVRNSFSNEVVEELRYRVFSLKLYFGQINVKVYVRHYRLHCLSIHKTAIKAENYFLGFC